MLSAFFVVSKAILYEIGRNPVITKQKKFNSGEICGTIFFLIKSGATYSYSSA